MGTVSEVGLLHFGDPLLDARQVARLLHVSESWVREHSNGKEPRLPAMKLGHGKTALVRFHISDIEEFVRSQRERAKSRTLTAKRWSTG